MALSIYTLPVKSDEASTNLKLTRGTTLKCLQIEGFILNCQALRLDKFFFFFLFFFNLNAFYYACSALTMSFLISLKAK